METKALEPDTSEMFTLFKILDPKSITNRRSSIGLNLKSDELADWIILLRNFNVRYPCEVQVSPVEACAGFHESVICKKCERSMCAQHQGKNHICDAGEVSEDQLSYRRFIKDLVRVIMLRFHKHIFHLVRSSLITRGSTPSISCDFSTPTLKPDASVSSKLIYLSTVMEGSCFIVADFPFEKLDNTVICAIRINGKIALFSLFEINQNIAMRLDKIALVAAKPRKNIIFEEMD